MSSKITASLPNPFQPKKTPAALSWLWMPFLTLVVYWLHGALLGMTDDEAYYWVLAQKPSLGYAFHPPAVAWSIALSEQLFSVVRPAMDALGLGWSGAARFPAAFFTAGMVTIALIWFQKVGVLQSALPRALVCLIAFAGIFGASWMIVPDLPLSFGWMICFLATWVILQHARTDKNPLASIELKWWMWLSIGFAVALLSKYSAVLIGVSVLMAIFWLVPYGAGRNSIFWKAVGALFIGLIIASIPIVIWNAQHGWASILYQIQERHSGGSFHGIRYLRFWAIQIVIAGPPLLYFAFSSWSRIRQKTSSIPDQVALSRYCLVWALPAFLVFCIQPAFSDFKPHWSLVVWIPFAMELAYRWATEIQFGVLSPSVRRIARGQMAFGWSLIVIVWLSCHIPIISYSIHAFTGKDPDPRWDVTNDMYGWEGLDDFVKEQLGPNGLDLPMVGSRYQTASQAAFVWPKVNHATRIPRSPKEFDEWPNLGLTDSFGPSWPKLLQPILFVADTRYNGPPHYKNALCNKIGRFSRYRGKFLAKWLDVWKCVPKSELAN